MNRYKEVLKEFKKYWWAVLLCALLIYTGVDVYYSDKDKPEEVEYIVYLKDLKENKIDTVYYQKDTEQMRYTLYNKDTKDLNYEERKEYEYDVKDWRITTYPSYDTFRKDLLESGVRVVVRDFSPKSITLISLIFSLAIPCALIYVLIMVVRNFKMFDSNKDFEALVETSDIHFDDVIGLEEVLDDIKFIVEMLRNPNLGDKTGARLPKGVLFSGDPGVGKTLIAKAIAGEANVPFIYINASSFVEMFVGLGARRVRDLFETARKHLPCILFIDEIDAVGGKRGRNNNSEADQTLNALLQEMDGFSTKEGLFVIGATNLPDKLDKALTRSGRFDRKLQINPPRDWKVRKEMFDFYLKDKPLSDDMDIESISRQTIGFTGADISSICNEASIIAAMSEKECIDMVSMEEAVDKHIFKGNRSKDDNKQRDDKNIVAYHEAGHAVCSFLLGVEIARASIVGLTSGVGGAVFHKERDSQFRTKEDFEKDIMVCYAGRVSESIKFDSVSTGASNDISQATQQLKAYVQKYGFDSDFGLLDMDILQENALLDAQFILEKMSKLSNAYYSKTYDLLSKHYDLVERLACALLKYESLTSDAIYEILNK